MKTYAGKGKTINQAGSNFGRSDFSHLTPYEQYLQRMEDLNPLKRGIPGEREWLLRAKLFGDTYPQAMAKLKMSQQGDPAEKETDKTESEAVNKPIGDTIKDSNKENTAQISIIEYLKGDPKGFKNR